MKHKSAIVLALISALSAGSALAADATTDNIYFYKNGRVSSMHKAGTVGRVVVSSDRTSLSVRDMSDAEIASVNLADIDSIAIAPLPAADVLDVRFNADGTATDVSPMANKIECYNADGLLTTYYNDDFGRYVANFNSKWAGTTYSYYKVDYTDTKNQAEQPLWKALADGHTFEAVVMAGYTGTIADAEAKFFSTHDAGGTGFMVSKISGARGNELTFLPNTNTTDKSSWRWTTSGVVPEAGCYYHVVGVWNKDEGQAYIYINGELKNKVSAPGKLRLPQKSGTTWIGLGADPNGAAATHAAWNGDLTLARIYDAPLGATEAERLWLDVKDAVEAANDKGAAMVTDVCLLSNLCVKEGHHYLAEGKGFAEDDVIELAGASGTFSCPAEMFGGEGALITIPAGFASGKYTVSLRRGNESQRLGFVTFNVVEQMPAVAKVIAHRGHWDTDGASQNSRAALRNAIDIKAYGAEIDIWATTDDRLVVFHDKSIGGKTIDESAYSAFASHKLGNGETLPVFEEFVEIMKENAGCGTKLIVEIKHRSGKAHSEARALKAAELALAMIKEAGIESMTEFIAFDYATCCWLAKNTDIPVSFLDSSSSPRKPADLLEQGIDGIDYKGAVLTQALIDEAHRLGMTANVWTIDNESEMVEWTNRGVDFITTNAPLAAQKIERHYRDYKD